MKRIGQYEPFKAQAAYYLVGACKEMPYAMCLYDAFKPELVGFKRSAGPLSAHTTSLIIRMSSTTTKLSLRYPGRQKTR